MANSLSKNQFLNTKPEHFVTADGSSTLMLSGLNEQYHSVNGAIQESSLVYIQNGFHYIKNQNVKILEIGFGTGLNCLLTYTANAQSKLIKTIEYNALEPFPIASDLVDKLNYISILKGNNNESFFKETHGLAFNEKQLIQPNFYFRKILQSVQEFNDTASTYDLIYFDAFGPAIQPEMWTQEVFDKMYTLLKYEGILVTYCAKGEVKRTLKAAGFKVENLPGPPGKREVTRALK